MAITYHSGERIQGTSTGVTAGYGDITGASYASKSKSITADDNNPKSITFNNDGSKMYLVGLQYSKIFEYTLSTPWDVSTAGSASTGYSVQTNPQDIFWSSDGTKLFLIRANVDTIYQYTPSSAYDITSLGTAVTRTYSDGSVDGQGIFIGDSGAKLYVINDTNNTVRQYNMSTPWDITTMSQTYNKTFGVGTTQESVWQSAVLNDDGTKMYTTGTNNDSAHQYTLTTAWDVSTASFDTGESFSMASEDTAPLTIRFGDSGKKLYMIGLTNKTAYQYTNATISSSDYTTLSNVETNSIFIETDTDRRYWFDGTSWGYENEATRGIFGGGYVSGYVNILDYITIATLGNATDFGDRTISTYVGSTASSETRGVWAGGTANEVTMDYVTIATTGNAIDFGDLYSGQGNMGGLSDRSRGVFGGGGYTIVNIIQYITIATTGNSLDFGDLTVARRSSSGVASSTRGVVGGGAEPSNSNIMDYITIATLGNATDFGDLTVARNYPMSVHSSTRGVFGGGDAYTNIMDYITISTTGNATDFGDLTVARYIANNGASSETRGVFGGGYTGVNSNVMDYITIATTGNATDFGDLTAARHGVMGLSG
jgi:hypothetical protein